MGWKPASILHKRSTDVNSIITQFSWLHLFLMGLTYYCLETKSPKTNFMYIFSSETEKSWMIMQKVSQMGSEADDTAIIWSLGCSIDSLSTRSASLPLMESHDFFSWRNVQTHTTRTPKDSHMHTQLFLHLFKLSELKSSHLHTGLSQTDNYTRTHKYTHKFKGLRVMEPHNE